MVILLNQEGYKKRMIIKYLQRYYHTNVVIFIEYKGNDFIFDYELKTKKTTYSLFNKRGME